MTPKPPLADPHEASSPSLRANTRGLAFVYGFAISLALLFVYNLFAYIHVKSAIQTEAGRALNYNADCGFPFTFYFYSVGGYLGFDQFLWSGIVGDVMFALLFSAFIGRLCVGLKNRLRAQPPNLAR